MISLTIVSAAFSLSYSLMILRAGSQGRKTSGLVHTWFIQYADCLKNGQI
jgi:hypothetical protein